MTHIKAPKTAEDEFIEIQSATGTPVQRWAVRSLTLCKLVGNSIIVWSDFNVLVNCSMSYSMSVSMSPVSCLANLTFANADFTFLQHFWLVNVGNLSFTVFRMSMHRPLPHHHLKHVAQAYLKAIVDYWWCIRFLSSALPQFWSLSISILPALLANFH